MLTKITSKILGLSSFTLFLFSCLITFNWHDSSNPASDLVTSLLNTFGLIIIFIWQFAVAHKSNKVLKDNGKKIKEFQYYKISFCLTIICFMLIYILSNMDPIVFSTENDIKRGEAFTFKRIYYGICFLGVIFYLLSVKGPSKLLKSAEHREEKSLKEYFGTFLLMLIPSIGVWFIRPRINKLESESA